ncbi:hypothetical protein DPX16_16271 [Anabarilius grahami]|uniref:Uncharacterized protein n=1 Tax=Anabarilius grahami TaxID=495550 RepID=A0A3N0XK49_ANAGA|nr:hypothetical protein DPX16_16271 [Anabarilius grahami]
MRTCAGIDMEKTDIVVRTTVYQALRKPPELKFRYGNSRAGRYIACDCHAHFVSKAGSLIKSQNRHHLLSNGAAFNRQSRSSLTSHAITRSLSKAIHLRHERDIASLVSDLRFCLLYAAPFESSLSFSFVLSQQHKRTHKRIIFRGTLPSCPWVMPSGSMSGGVSGPTSPPHPTVPSRPLRPSRYVPVSAATAFLVGATTLFFCFTNSKQNESRMILRYSFELRSADNLSVRINNRQPSSAQNRYSQADRKTVTTQHWEIQ